MCRLLAVYANKPVDIRFSFNRFSKKLGSMNPDGWGIGWYEENSAVVKKRPNPILCEESIRKSQTLCKEIRSHIFIAHVRRKGKFKASYTNTHPFMESCYIFAHNGRSGIGSSIGKQLSANFIRKIKGQTASEKYFYWVVQNLLNGKNDLETLRKALVPLEKQNNGLNFLLSDGTKLYAFRYSSDKSHTLYYLRRDPCSTADFSAQSKEDSLMLQSKVLNREKAIVICSEKLTNNEDWIGIENGQLICVNEDLSVRETAVFN